MPTKHIDELTWRKVEQATVQAVITTKTSIKDTEVLKILILKGLEVIKESDWQKYADKKRK